MVTFQIISETDLDALCRVLADYVTHKDIPLLLRDCNIEPQGGSPKWERMLLALTVRQRRDRCGNNVIAFLCHVLHPGRFRQEAEQHTEVLAKVNYHLAFYGTAIGEDAKPKPVPKAETRSEAEVRASELNAELRRRFVHEDVLRFCRPELLQQNYFHCVLEASKSLADKIRSRVGLFGDGAKLVDEAFSVDRPLLALNALQTDSERSEQKGFGNFLKGIFGMYRNPIAHAPKIAWGINKNEALDALTIISYAHRRLDEAVTVPVAAKP